MRHVLLLLAYMTGSHALDNGLAQTPPMGWMSWERFRCVTDCKDDPANCISENLYMTMADKMVSDGYLDAGYEYVNIDDCWMTKTRDENGRLQADRERFPSGIKALADYASILSILVHSKGLKLGIYEDFGTGTCEDYPGSKFYMDIDADTFAGWGVDMLKFDGCNSGISDMPVGYPLMEMWLNKTGRPILYSCSWPAYFVVEGKIPEYEKIAESCNIWRNYYDIQDSWASLKTIIEFYGDDVGNFSKVAGPGNFNDPDMLIIGNYGLSYEQQRVQMALWAIMASPLLMSNDLRDIADASREILLNKNVIAINQDRLGIQGSRIFKMNDFEIWTRPIEPTGSVAFSFLNLADSGTPVKANISTSGLELDMHAVYNVTEGFSGSVVGTLTNGTFFTVGVNPSGVFLGKATKIA
ncbi:hypothetical protein ScPMuIL_010952 [Solemya velum]